VGKAVLLVALFALVVYGVLRLLELRRARRRPPPPTRPTRRAVAPDDDPDFLRDLERKRRREQRDAPKDEPDPG
jgi:hypothetical protein